MADATDLKSVIRKGVRVRVPPRVPLENSNKWLFLLGITAFLCPVPVFVPVTPCACLCMLSLHQKHTKSIHGLESDCVSLPRKAYKAYTASGANGSGGGGNASRMPQNAPGYEGGLCPSAVCVACPAGAGGGLRGDAGAGGLSPWGAGQIWGNHAPAAFVSHSLQKKGGACFLVNKHVSGKYKRYDY